MRSMYIGSGDISALLSGVDTKSYRMLLRRFLSGEKPVYNAKASPIDALRIGAILEDVYQKTLPFGYFPQYEVYSSDMDVFRATIDFAFLEGDRITDFEELKSINFEAFLDMIKYKDTSYRHYKDMLINNYKKYYNQVQQQLLCTGLDAATLTFLAVYSYDDEENYNRVIEDNDLIKFRIERDESVISFIKERGKPFQYLKDYYRK